MKQWNLSDYDLMVGEHRHRLQRLLFLLALISLAFNFYYGVSVTQLGGNPLLKQDLDPTYLLFMALRIPQMLSGPVAVLFDLLLVISCIASLVWTRVLLFPRLFFVLHFIYFIVYNMMAGHHYISIGLLIMSFPFIFSNGARFVSIFTLCRFIFCFMMFSAACWKIVRGNLFHVDQTNMLLVSTHLSALASNTGSAATVMVKFFLRHRYLSHALWCILILLEGVFILGFFSFRWDKLLLWAYLLFFVGGWLLFNIYNFDNLLFLLTLTPVLGMLNKAYTDK